MYVLYHSFTMARMLYVREECAGCTVCIAGVVTYINKGLVLHCLITLAPRVVRIPRVVSIPRVVEYSV